MILITGEVYLKRRLSSLAVGIKDERSPSQSFDPLLFMVAAIHKGVNDIRCHKTQRLNYIRFSTSIGTKDSGSGKKFFITG